MKNSTHLIHLHVLNYVFWGLVYYCCNRNVIVKMYIIYNICTLHMKFNLEIVISTVWRKNNACFSNNCNFVYFQCKKLMLTQKQPVINAVLITYVDYSITENYIRKMASFLLYTRPEPLLKFLHHIY